MNAEDFRAARLRLGLSLYQLARILNIEPRTIRKWEMVDGSNARPPNPMAARVLEWLENGFRPPEWPTGKTFSIEEK